MHAKSLQSCLTLCDSMDCRLPGSSVYGFLQARILEWVAVPSPRGIFPTQVLNLCLLCLQMCVCVYIYIYTHIYMMEWGTSQVSLVVKNPPANAGDMKRGGFNLCVRNIPLRGHGNPLQHSCLENPKDRGPWQPMVHRVAKSQT